MKFSTFLDLLFSELSGPEKRHLSFPKLSQILKTVWTLKTLGQLTTREMWEIEPDHTSNKKGGEGREKQKESKVRQSNFHEKQQHSKPTDINYSNNKRHLYITSSTMTNALHKLHRMMYVQKQTM